MGKHNTTLYIVRLASFSFQSNHFRMMRLRQLLDQRKYHNENTVNESLCNTLEI